MPGSEPVSNSEDDPQIHIIKEKLEHNEFMLRKAFEIRKLLTDETAQAHADTQIREYQKNVEYLVGELKKVTVQSSSVDTGHVQSRDVGSSVRQNRKQQQQRSASSSADSSNASAAVAVSSTHSSSIPSQSSREANVNKSDDHDDSDEDLCLDSCRRSSFDLMRSDRPISRIKVVLLLQELEYRLHCEEAALKRMKRVSDSMAPKLVAASPGTQHWHMNLDQKRLECQEKIGLLKRAVQKYQSINIDNALMNPEEDEAPMQTVTSAVPPIKGNLQLKVREARDLTHAPSRTYPNRQAFVAVKHKDQVYRTHLSRTDAWSDCIIFEIDKMAEVELVIYDQEGSDRTHPIGLLWLKMMDVTQDIRKHKQNRQRLNTASSNPSFGAKFTSSAIDDQGMTEWIDVEPAGRILVDINFVRNTSPKRRGILKRVGALREKRGQVYTLHGHHFVAKRFLQVMRCSICSDYMVNLAYQCDDCRLACHKECYSHVVTRCAKSPTENTNEGMELRLCIPHRFEPVTVVSSSWCCHCSFMLPFASTKTAVRCAECGQTCHTRCQEFVPNFCGTSMKEAYKLLSTIREVTEAQSRSSTASDENSGRMPRPRSSGDVYDLLSPDRPRAMPHGISSYSMAPPRQYTRQIYIDDFNFLCVLGRGNWGKVLLAENKYTRHLYAIKALRKHKLIHDDDRRSLFSEREVFHIASKHRFPFLLQLHSAFASTSRVFFVMEYMQGGDMMSLIHKRRQPFSEDHTRFYAGEILLALEFLHKHDIVYRDLKLDNVLLGSDGHVRLGDYGLCKFNMGYNATTGSFCGTPEFMAPEICAGSRYTRSVDWWTFGVLIYEMLTCEPPFRGDHEDEIFDSIMTDKLVVPDTVSRSANNILQCLLKKDPRQRLGGGKRDSLEIRPHPFFQGIHWDELLAKRVEPPLMISFEGPADTSCFDREFTSEFPVFTPVHERLLEEEQRCFDQFPYIAKWALTETAANVP